jgi:hypothetical protein
MAIDGAGDWDARGAIRRIAERRLAGGVGTIETMPMRKGDGRLCLHHAYGRSDPKQAGGCLRIVEKRTNVGVEATAAAHIRDLRERRPPVFPEIYEVGATGREHVILMEYIDGVGAVPPLNRSCALSLTSALSQIDAVLCPLFAEKSVPSVLRGWVAKLETGARLAPAVSSELNRVVAALERMESGFGSRSPVVSHNDFFWPNMSAGTSGSGTCRIVDVGLTQRNIVGADLHHFARASLDGEPMATFHDEICGIYASAMRADRHSVVLASRVYAIVRSIVRLKRYTHDAKADRISRELAVLDALVSRFLGASTSAAASWPSGTGA